MKKQEEKYDIQKLYLGRLILIDSVRYVGDRTVYEYQALKGSLFLKKGDYLYNDNYIDLLTGIEYESEETFLEVGKLLFNSKNKQNLEACFLQKGIEYKQFMTLDEILCALGFKKREEQQEVEENTRVSFSKYQRKRK